MADILVRGSSASKGIVKRSPREEMALRVRMLAGRHLGDVYQAVLDELGDERGKEVGKVDMSRNTLRSYVGRLGKAYLVPPLVEDLDADFAALIGDMTASTTQEMYATAGGRPMPVRLQQVSAEVQRHRLGCNWAGTLLGWAEASRRPFAQLVTPDDLEVVYASDDPLTPTVITHFRRRRSGQREYAAAEIYDLTDPRRPSYRVMDGDVDRTDEVMDGVVGWDGNWLALWRYEPTRRWPEGRPFHRIVISGDPRNPFLGVELVEGTLRVAAGYTHFWAGVRDAGFPRTHAVGLHIDRAGSDSDTGATGGGFGPEVVAKWHHDNPDTPGSLQQMGPGFDPKVVGEAVRGYELGLLEMTGLPVAYERTGGEPTKTEAEALAEAIGATYADCRGHDALVLRRLAAVANRASALVDDMEPLNIPERALSVLYREEIKAALEAAGNVSDDTDTDTDK